MATSPPRFACARLLRRRELWWPTWRGWLMLAFVLAVLCTAAILGVHPFLALHRPLPRGAFVMEGWMGRTTVARAAAGVAMNSYSPCFATGGAIDEDSPIQGYTNYAESGAAQLREAGISQVVAVPSAWVKKDRTYTCALDLRTWLLAHGGIPAEITVFTQGVHARRSRLLFQKAFGSETQVGVISVPPRNYDPARWFTSSEGVREVINEAIAYFYARFCFWPTKP